MVGRECRCDRSTLAAVLAVNLPEHEQRAEGIAEQILTVANGALTGRIDSDRARVAIDAFKWTAGKMAPKRYGDKITNEHTGPNGGPVQVSTIRIVSGNE